MLKYRLGTFLLDPESALWLEQKSRACSLKIATRSCNAFISSSGFGRFDDGAEAGFVARLGQQLNP